MLGAGSAVVTKAPPSLRYSIEDLGPVFANPRAINAAGQVVGWAKTSGDAAWHAFRYTDGVGMEDLGTLGGDSGAEAINDASNVVGWSYTATGQHAFVCTAKTGMVDLNDAIDPAAGWTLVAAYGINASGEIVGQGVIDGGYHGFHLTPAGDDTPPVVTPKVSPEPNAAGWNSRDVTASCVCEDALSGVADCGPASFLVTTEGAGQLRTATATDQAGNTSGGMVDSINIDKTAPSITCYVMPASLWPANHQLVPVSVTVNLTDSLSGRAGFTLASASSTPPGAAGDIQGFVSGTAGVSGFLRAEKSVSGGERQYWLSYSGFDLAGNTADCKALVTVPHDQGGTGTPAAKKR